MRLGFGEAVQTFVGSRRSMNASPRTIDTYRERLGLLAGWLDDQNIRTVATVTTDLLRSYLLYLKDSHQDRRAKYPKRLSPVSVLDHFLSVRAFFRWLHSEGAIRQDPTSRLERPKVPKLRKPFISSDATSALLELWTPSWDEKKNRPKRTPADSYNGQYMGEWRWKFLASRNRALLFVFVDTGLRLGEVLGLDAPSVSWADRTLKVMGKGNRERVTPFSQDTARVLDTYLGFREKLQPRGQGPLFLTFQGQPMTKAAVRTVIQQVKKAIGFEGRLYPHALRHTFARMALLNGADVFTLQKMMGHSSVAVTREYVNLLDEDVKRGHASWSPVTRLRRGR